MARRKPPYVHTPGVRPTLQLGRSICLAGRIARRATESSDLPGRCRARQGADIATRTTLSIRIDSATKAYAHSFTQILSAVESIVYAIVIRNRSKPVLYNGLVK